MPKPSHASTRASEDADRSPPLGDVARDAACRRLAREARKFPNLDIVSFEPAGLDPRDAALAHAICDNAVRRWITLSYLLNLNLRTPLERLEPKLQGALLCGASQMAFFDRVPPHAAINHAVEWAKKRIRPRAGAMVNAILRKLSATIAPERDERFEWEPTQIPLSDGRATRLTETVLPSELLERISIQVSLPLPLLRRWERTLGAHRLRAYALHSIADPPIILNTEFLAGAIEEDDLMTPHDAPGHHVFTGTHGQLVALLSSRSDLWVQDPASALAVGSVADLRPRVVADLCAGLGTKTRQLSHVFPEAEIYATDVNRHRYETLRSLFMNHERVHVEQPPALRERLLGRADLVLLDVPCSNSGVLARRPEARYRLEEAGIASLVQTQRQLIADSIPLLAEGRGSILYSTCSLEPEENESQLAWAHRWHELRAERQKRRLPSGMPGDAPSHYSDGAFASLLA